MSHIVDRLRKANRDRSLVAGLSLNTILLYAEDIERECRISLATARRWLSNGKFGRPVKIGRRLAIEREAFIEGIRRIRDGRAPATRRDRPFDHRQRDDSGRFRGSE